MAFWTKSFNCRIKKFMLSYHIQYFKFTVASIIWKKHRDKIHTSAKWPGRPSRARAEGRVCAPSRLHCLALTKTLHLSRDFPMPGKHPRFSKRGRTDSQKDFWSPSLPSGLRLTSSLIQFCTCLLSSSIFLHFDVGSFSSLLIFQPFFIQCLWISRFVG